MRSSRESEVRPLSLWGRASGPANFDLDGTGTAKRLSVTVLAGAGTHFIAVTLLAAFVPGKNTPPSQGYSLCSQNASPRLSKSMSAAMDHVSSIRQQLSQCQRLQMSMVSHLQNGNESKRSHKSGSNGHSASRLSQLIESALSDSPEPEAAVPSLFAGRAKG